MSNRDIRDASILDVLPESIASDPDIVALARAIDPELRDIADSIVEAIIMPRLDAVPEWVLDEVAWSMRLAELALWDRAPVEGKRAILRNVFAVRKRSGTRYAVRRIFDLLTLTATIVEWWEEGAAPHTYRIRVDASLPGITLDTLLKLRTLLLRFARASQQLTELGVESNQRGVLRCFSSLGIGHHIEISYGG